MAYWLTCDGVSTLLSQLGATHAEFTHQQLDDLPNTPTTRYIRDVLAAAAVLPPRDELETWLEEGPEKRREVRSFITWATGRGLAGELAVPRAPVAAPSVFGTDEDQAEQLHRCLDDDALPLDVRTAGALTLLFGLQHTRLLELTVHDIIDDDTVVALNLNGHRLPLPPEVAQLGPVLSRDHSFAVSPSEGPRIGYNRCHDAW